MKKRSLNSAIALVAAIIMTFSCILIFTSCSEEEDAVTEISSAVIKDNKIKVTATLDDEYAKAHSSDTLYILALQAMDPTLSLDGALQVAECRAKSKMTFEFPLDSGKGYSYVSSAFVLAEKTQSGYAPLSGLYYTENPEELSSKAEAPLSVSGIKGYISDDVVGSQLLGADHLLIEAEMNDIILEDFIKDSVKFDLDGISYYYDRNAVERMDKLVNDAKAASMRIYIRTVLREGDEETPEFLYYKRSADKNGYLPDLSNERTVRYIRAFNAFLASRYGIADFIIGEKVNGYGSSCYAGKLTSEEFEAMYSYWARLSYQMIRSVNSEAKLYISIDNTWRTDITAQSIGTKVFLSRFAQKAKNEGDYSYDIAMSLGDENDYAALVSGRGYDYSRIGATNLSEVTKFLETAEMRNKSERRSIIIDGLTIPTSITEKDRASYYTFSYYSAAENGFGAVLYSGSVNSSDGIRSDLYYSMLMCGTDLNSQLSDYTEHLPEIKIPDFNEYIKNDLTYLQGAESNIDGSTEKNKKPISLDPSEFDTSGSVYNIRGKLENDGTTDRLLLIADIEPSESSGSVSAKKISSEALISSAYVGITAKCSGISHITLRISDGNHIYIAQAEASQAEKTYYFDISKFSKQADSSADVKLELCVLGDNENDGYIEISELAFYGSSGNGAETVIIIIVVAVTALAIIGLIVLLAIRRKRKSSSSRSDDD